MSYCIFNQVCPTQASSNQLQCKSVDSCKECCFRLHNVTCPTPRSKSPPKEPTQHWKMWLFHCDGWIFQPDLKRSHFFKNTDHDSSVPAAFNFVLSIIRSRCLKAEAEGPAGAIAMWFDSFAAKTATSEGSLSGVCCLSSTVILSLLHCRTTVVTSWVYLLN